jgi:lipopolysaccharide transport system ATP-binding protein
MSGTVIQVENLGKKYLIRHEQRERYTALRDVLTNKAKSFGKRLIGLQPQTSNLQPTQEEFWALKDVSFEVKQGDRVGIIGRNGAGKTTLLKLLSRITEPTAGRIRIKGRVASLLEVGTGFHPELTGRENIFLNGAILGMSKAEIKKKFDEIVDFAEIEKFLDTPVKRYSSGMYVRLAFAVAAHLEPEILLVDEVLAVGDAAFQKKCLGKMGEVAKEGRTVLFVSHNMGAISGLCEKGIYLKEGVASHIGDIYTCVNNYMAAWSNFSQKRINFTEKNRTFPQFLRKAALLQGIEMVNEDMATAWQIPFKSNPAFKIYVKVVRKLPTLELGIALYNNNLVEIASSLSSDSISVENIDPGEYEILAKFHDLLLLPGTYALGLGLKSGLSDMIMEDYIQEAAYFEVTPSDDSTQYRAYTRRGAFIPKIEYAINSVFSKTEMVV